MDADLEWVRSNFAAAQRHSTFAEQLPTTSLVTDTTSALIYSSLDSSRNEIRLITIKPGELSSPIQCSLSTTSLRDSPKYEALSYVWGDRGVLVTVQLNDHQFQITQNLAAALRFLRSETKERILWIDALCINQLDIDERNAQVRAMRFIYQSAQRVVSWLGDADEFTFDAMRLVGEAACDNFSPGWMRASMLHVGGAYFALYMFLQAGRREYWLRVWITQEIACARDGVLQCGNFIMPFWALRKFIAASAEVFAGEVMDDVNKKYDFGSVVGYANVLGFLINHEISQVSMQGAPLLDILQSNHHKMASYPEDKVYGLLGLSDLSSSAHPGLQIDYRRSVRDIYIGVVQGIVEETLKLDIICSSHPGSGYWRSPSIRGERQLNLPSWTPDWSFYTRRPLRTPSHNRVKGAAGNSLPSVRFQVHEGIMGVTGFRVGLVSVCGNCQRVYTIQSLHNHYAEIFQGVLEWRRLLFNVVEYSHAMGLLFCQNIQGNFEGDTAPQELLQLFKHWETSTMSHSHNGRFEFNNTQKALLENTQRACQDSRFFLFDMGRSDTPGRRAAGCTSYPSMGVGPPTVREDDIICIFLGCSFPVLIRLVDDYFVFVGAVYVHNLMNGEAVQDLEDSLSDLECFKLH